ncbi:hypothetical protein BBJ28_00026320 [Nothophytophthora sp. Chile5]|nr:hypothetical protein BBJ28_00026320 [Nothophytophthora sp. Chile5]
MATFLVIHEVLRPLCTSFADLMELLYLVAAAGGRAFVACLARGLRPRFPEWTVTFDCFQAVVGSALAAKGQNLVRLPNAQIMRRNTELLGGLLGWISCLQYGMKLHSFHYRGLRHFWLHPSTPQADSPTTRQITVLYFHGGGYTVLCPRFYVDFCSRLLHQLRTQQQGNPFAFRVLLADYRKLPEHSFPAPMDDAAAMYDYLVTTCQVAPQSIVIAGDSAGAGLVLATLRRLREAGKQLPLGAICASPMIDWPGKDDASAHCFVQPPLLTGIRDFSRATSAASDEVCSLHFDLNGLPPMLVQTGDKDLLHHQAHRLAIKARADGVEVQLDTHVNMPHVFSALPSAFMPAGELGVAKMATFILQLLQE